MGQDHPKQLVYADKAPNAVIHLKQSKHNDTDDDPRADGMQESFQIFSGYFRKAELKPKPKGNKERAGNKQHIQYANDQRTLQPFYIQLIRFILHMEHTS